MQREGLLLPYMALEQFHSFLPEEVEQECLAIASCFRLLEVSEVRTLCLPFVAGDDSFPTERAGIDASSFGLVDVDDTSVLVASRGV